MEYERTDGGAAKGQEGREWAGWEVEDVVTNPRIGTRQSAPKCVVRRIYDERSTKEQMARQQKGGRDVSGREGRWEVVVTERPAGIPLRAPHSVIQCIDDERRAKEGDGGSKQGGSPLGG
jgi:hypothetical protein